ncbi:LysR family transcriptional regulator [Wenjunlia vitaminophila]|uniref:LysR family transcriptional regulator n=1 Tax=Wenjunlia vitaminophila TaxID=76728 RepID=A0A0T6LVV8_WENVI|nr:LysR family transcriptional regulator [Wenjunlia vitaminophila]KRV49855.1 LysR family transcriptional regulator [Wenjunlia vitaminophila]
MLNLERLRVLYAVARHGSISGAAEGLHVTTSAVSQQIGKLERETGQQLLTRNGRGVRLTDAARVLAQHAGRILSQMEAAEADLEAHRGSVVGDLVIGAFPTAARGLGPRALSTLSRDHGRLRASLYEMEPDESLPRLRRGDVDVAIVTDWANAPLAIPQGLARSRLCDDVVDVALPSDHPLAGNDAVELRQLAGESWICWPKGAFCQEWLILTLRAQGVEPRVTHTAAEHPTQLALVAAGLGVAVTPRMGRGPVPGGVRVVPVVRAPLTRHVHAAWRADAAGRPSIRAVVEAFQAAGAG